MLSTRGIQSMRENAVRFVHARATGIPGEYRYSATGEPILYSSCYALMTLHYLDALPADPTLRAQWADYLLSWQDAETGAFLGPEVAYAPESDSKHDAEHLAMHLTTTLLPCLDILGIKPRHPLRFAHRFLQRENLDGWLRTRDWHDAWLEGNNLLFMLQLLIHLRDAEGVPEAHARIQELFEWLDREVDPQTGLWGTNGFCSPFIAMCGGYHQLLAYYAERRPVTSPDRIIDLTLDLQHPDGGFHPDGGGGACEDVDAVDILVNLYKRTDHRRPEIRVALRSAALAVLGMQMADGGFVYRRDEPFTHMGMAATRTPPNHSTMFATWFRVHTLALASEVLHDGPLGKFTWQFNPSLSMGWHSGASVPSGSTMMTNIDELWSAGPYRWLGSRLGYAAMRRLAWLSPRRLIRMQRRLRRRFAARRQAKLHAKRLDTVRSILVSADGPDTSMAERDFDRLARLSCPLREYGYDAASSGARAEERRRQLAETVPGFSGMNLILEAACGDGMTSAVIAASGKTVCMTDIRDWRDERARHLPFQESDLSVIDRLEAERLDLVFSYNAFEHFCDPRQALSVLVRAVRPGGHLFFEFGPLYCGPWGLHAYRMLPMPYPQFLFSREFLERKLRETGVRDLGRELDELQHLNQWRVQQFRDLWESSGCAIVLYEEIVNDQFLETVTRYPASFTGRGLSLRDLTTQAIRVVLRKPIEATSPTAWPTA